MKKQRKMFERPKMPWSRPRLETEKKLVKEYGLRRKREIWRAESILRDFRRRARELAAIENKEAEKILLDKLRAFGMIKTDAHLDDILTLTIEDVLDRRLQTIVMRKGIAHTARQARQYITHGHISLDGRRVKWPSALVGLAGEGKISFYGKSKVKLAAQQLVKKKEAPKKEEKPVEKPAEKPAEKPKEEKKEEPKKEEKPKEKKEEEPKKEEPKKEEGKKDESKT